VKLSGLYRLTAHRPGPTSSAPGWPGSRPTPLRRSSRRPTRNNATRGSPGPPIRSLPRTNRSPR
jgi:hypothetical protein